MPDQIRPKYARPGWDSKGHLLGDTSLTSSYFGDAAVNHLWLQRPFSSFAALGLGLLFSPSQRCNYVGEALKGQPQDSGCTAAEKASGSLCAFDPSASLTPSRPPA